MGNSVDQYEFDVRMRPEVARFVIAGRTESAAFLMWYLRNFFRLEELEATYSVCDNTGDKGIDGVYVDEDEEEVHLFQSKFSPDYARDQGDNDIRNLAGAKTWFANAQSIQSLLESTASDELKELIQASSVYERIKSGYPVFSHFVTNKVFNREAREFLNVNRETLIGHDLPSIFKEYTYVADAEIITGPTDIHLANLTKIEQNLPPGVTTRVYSIPATEIVKLDGIKDGTLFYRNVRYGLGRTRVNRDITHTIELPSEHNKFFLYHNGLTLVCDSLSQSGNVLTLNNYSVINGCQSVLTLYENSGRLTNDMELLVKIIELNQASPLVSDITKNTNNQNPIRIQDLKGDDRVQKAIQSQFLELFGQQVLYQRKRGEVGTGYLEVIDLDLAAQLVESFYNGYPQSTHLKAKLFGERYADIFSRHTNAARIYLAYLTYKTILENVSSLTNIQIRYYGLAHFFFLHYLSEVLRSDALGASVVDNPESYLRDHRTRLKEAIKRVWLLRIPDIDAYIAEYTVVNGYFDYKNVFKRTNFVTEAIARLMADNRRIVIRHAGDSFQAIYNSLSG